LVKCIVNERIGNHISDLEGTPKDVVQDIQFTTKGDALYVIARSWRLKEIWVKSLKSKEYKIKSI
jgi:hypothetical protein